MNTKKAVKKDKCSYDIEYYLKKIANNTRAKTVLDVGSGTGSYTKYFCRNNNHVYGIDISDSRKQIKKRNYIFSLYDGNRFPFENSSFDLVISWDVIEHIKNDEQFVKEIYRVLKPGGRCIVGTPNRTRLSSTLMAAIGKPVHFPLVISDDGEFGKLIHEREYVGKELTNLFTRNNFRSVSLDYYWFGLRSIFTIGTRKPIIKKYSQYLFCYASK